MPVGGQLSRNSLREESVLQVPPSHASVGHLAAGPRGLRGSRDMKERPEAVSLKVILNVLAAAIPAVLVALFWSMLPGLLVVGGRSALGLNA